MFRVFVPGFGNIFVNAPNAQAAITGALRYLESNEISGTLNPADIDNLQAIPFAQDAVPPGGLVVNSGGVGGTTPTVPTATATPTGGATGETSTGQTPLSTGGGGGGASLAPDPEEVSAFGQYRNYLRSIGLDPDSIIGGTAAAPGRFQDILGVHGLNQVLHNLTGTFTEGGGSQFDQITGQGGPQSFLDFVRTQGNQGIAATARGALQALAGQGPGGENSFLGVLQQARPGTDIGNILEGTALQALRTSLSPAALGLFGNQALGLAGRRFEDSLAGAAAGGSTAPTYSQFLLRSLGLA